MPSMRTAAATAALVLVAAGCGGNGGTATPTPAASENSPPGDIPDNQAFVAYAPPHAGYSVKVPEGWARTTADGATSFTDKLNTVTLEAGDATSAPTVADAKRTAPAKARVSLVKRTSGPAVRITYLAQSRPDPVTGKARTNAVERYLFFHAGREAILTLSGPKGADNVDPWRIITDSLRWTP
ncbi:hypothetical protein [Solirubrobacter soli]|uniref:hypothetical protein n=1 Tax=Solirubrobacter soli TaxID=363832 RepID=UPI000561E92B|nr:hypothetical protein [Solirubrobacter soli]